MSKITIPYHLAIPSIICIVGLMTIILLRKKLFTNRRNKIFWISVIVFLSCYAFLVGGATYIDMYYQWDLNRYDLDKDGFFGGQEITKEQEAAMSKVINDTGRNFSFITGFIFSFFISAASYFAGWILVSIKDRVRDKRNENHT
ncbi:MAG TPA: hypothetical protein PLF32_06520 [Bacteroidales bacterium]|nr:hypothetical protein [Bacteroidales bacterium]HOR82292.1 hypothetical protein [Bacteroidales bacterium]HPJ91227.1 hypothetical protein [Bacteroidales bacterium]